LTVLNRPDTVPKGSDIERFLYTIVKHLHDQTSRIDPTNQAPAFSMVSSGLRRLIGSLKFDFADFNLTVHERLRITNVMEDLYKQGKLTKDPKREVQWLGAFLTRKLATAFLEDALNNGTLSWDVTMSKALSIIWTSALMCRSGDVARNRDYHGLECLIFEHIHLKLGTIEGLERLTGLFTV
jgi:hypothetical protein